MGARVVSTALWRESLDGRGSSEGDMRDAAWMCAQQEMRDKLSPEATHRRPVPGRWMRPQHRVKVSGWLASPLSSLCQACDAALDPAMTAPESDVSLSSVSHGYKLELGSVRSVKSHLLTQNWAKRQFSSQAMTSPRDYFD